jgi:hypothetical protein
MFCQENAAQDRNIKRTDKSFENMRKFEYFRTTVTNQNYIHEEIKGQVQFGYYLTEFRIFHIPISYLKVQNYNITCCFVRV